MTTEKTMTREQGMAAVKQIMADPRFSPEVKTYVKQHCAYPDANTIVYLFGDYMVSQGEVTIPWVEEIFRAI